MKEIIYTEKLNSIRNEMTHLWTSFFVVGGGAVALFINNKSWICYCLGTLGLLFAILFFNAYFQRRVELLKLLKDLEENK